jgi:hypothetical protein
MRLRGSLSARWAIPQSASQSTPVATGAPAAYSASSCFSFYNNKTPKQ